MAEQKILIVEDDKDTLRAMAVRLKAQKYSVVIATDAISAISTARKEKPDLIVLDLGLPGGDGFVVMQRLRTNYDLLLIPIIVVSARDPVANERRALEGGAHAFLQKPVENAVFLAAIENALSKSAAQEK
jgi:two-component system, OmpR family, KDP operon response regulator KdpE